MKTITIILIFLTGFTNFLQAESFVLLRWNDRRVDDGWDRFKERTIGYRYSLLINLELNPFKSEEFVVPKILILNEFRLYGRLKNEIGHFEPLNIDSGGGLIFENQKTEVRVVFTSKHYLGEFYAETQSYNYVTLKYSF